MLLSTVSMPYRGGSLELLVGVLDGGFEVCLFRQRIVVLPLQSREPVLHCLQLRLLEAQMLGRLTARVRARSTTFEHLIGKDLYWQNVRT